MLFYFTKRLFLIIPTIFIIIAINFFVIQAAPGGPIEKIIQQINHHSANAEVASGGAMNFSTNEFANNLNKNNLTNSHSEIDPELLADLQKQFGFNLTLQERFFLMIKKLSHFDLGTSFYQDKKVIDLILEKMPVSVSLGLGSIIVTYFFAIWLGIKKAINDNSNFDKISTILIVIFNAIPGFLLAIGLIILFCGGNFLNIFPIKGLVSANFSQLNWWQKILDYLWHLFLPILAMSLGSIAALTIFCKNSFLAELNKSYVFFAISKGVNLNRLLYFHIFRNGLMIVIANLPAQLITVFFTSSMLIEVIFSLDGIGLLGYEAMISRDYPVIFGTLFLFSIFGLIANIISDLCYHLIDPRLNFNAKNK